MKHSSHTSLSLKLGLIGASAIAIPYFATQAKAVDQLPDSGNYIDVSLGYLDLEGNEAAFLSRYPIKKHAYGGIERYQYSGYVGDYTELKVEGRAMYDNNDYLFGVEFLNEDVGYFKFRWEEYRVFYDGSGKYFPGSDTWIEVYDDELAIDRGKLQIEAGLFLDNGLDLDFSYTRLTREGMKSSTSLADTTLTGDYGTRNIVPTFLDIDETRDIFEIGAKKRFDKTKVHLSLRSETSDVNDARKITRRPNESAFRRVTHRESYDTDLLSARFSSITEIDEKNTFTAGIAYTEIDVNTTGGRIYGTNFDDPFDVDFQGQNRDHGWTALMAESQIDQWILNANWVNLPAKNWKAIYALRLEEMNTGIESEFTETGFSTRSNTFETEEIALDADRDWTDTAASAEFIYTGQENVVYNGSVLYTTGDGDFLEEEFDVESGDQLLERLSNTERDVLKLAVGAKFYPSSGVRTFVQYYHKERDNKYNHIIDPTEPEGGDRFPAFTDEQDFTTDDINVSFHYKGPAGFSGLTRFDYQNSTIDSKGQGLEWAHAYDRTAFVVSQSINYALETMFLQANIVYADDSRESPVSTIGGGVADTVVVLDGDFWNANLGAYWGLGEGSALGVTLFHNQTDNYVDNSEFAQPYGDDVVDNGVSATYTRMLSDAAQLTVRYAYYDSEDKTANGFNDYEAQILYTSIRYRF